jgi:hypothetical protein
MPAHVWNCTSDFEYCALDHCKIVNGTVVLDNALSGTIISDIRDATPRIFDHEEIIPRVAVPAGTSVVLYIRSGWYNEYTDDTWTAWKQVNEAETRMEYTLSLTSSRIIADYDINLIKNIYFRNDYRFLSLASSLKTLYLNGLDPNVPYSDELHSILWSAKINEAIVGFAKVGHNSLDKSIYATDATTANNIITLTNKLPDENVDLIVEYIPRHYIYTDMRNRYFQWKYVLNSNVPGTSPVIRSMTANYRLNIQTEMCDEFPKFFRRL